MRHEELWERLAEALNEPEGCKWLEGLEEQVRQRKFAARVDLVEQRKQAIDGGQHQLARSLEGRLKATAPPEIREALRRLNQLPHPEPRIQREHIGYRDGVQPVYKFHSNERAIEARIAAIQTARRELEGLLVEAIPPDELERKIEQVFDAIPDGCELAETGPPVEKAFAMERAAL